jgi:hypothetical protein
MSDQTDNQTDNQTGDPRDIRIQEIRAALLKHETPVLAAAAMLCDLEEELQIASDHRGARGPPAPPCHDPGGLETEACGKIWP